MLQILKRPQVTAVMASETNKLVNARDTAADPSSPKQSPLLKLPGELRNRIYRSALLEQPYVTVGRAAFVEPGLLLVCHQIRREAAPIYYGENKFRIPAPNYDSATCLRWMAKRTALSLKYDVRIQCSLTLGNGSDRQPDWENALQWLHRFHMDVVTLRMDRPSEAGAHLTPGML